MKKIITIALREFKSYFYIPMALIIVPAFLVLMGFYFGKSYLKFSRYVDYAAIGTLVLTAVLILCYIAMKRFSRRLEEKNIE